jgi:hypothetical protein
MIPVREAHGSRNLVAALEMAGAAAHVHVRVPVENGEQPWSHHAGASADGDRNRAP